MQKATESRTNLPTKFGIRILSKCRGFAAVPRHFCGFWPRALARGLSWSVHVGACFQNCNPGLLNLDFRGNLVIKLPLIQISSNLPPTNFLLILAFYSHPAGVQGWIEVYPSLISDICNFQPLYLHFDSLYLRFFTWASNMGLDLGFWAL